MANITVSVPDELVPDLVLALQWRYPDLVGTNAQIGKAGIRELLRETYVNYRRLSASAEAEQAMQVGMDEQTRIYTDAAATAAEAASGIA